MYERWVDNNTRRVSELSQGRLGYIHIPSMDEAGLDCFVRALYSDNFDKDAIVLDVRYNSGGYTHDQVLNYLVGKEHTFFRRRDGGQGMVLRSHDRKWTKPVVLLINNRSFSDAEIFPSAFRTLGLGKLVGQPTGGQVIGTSRIRLIDGSYFMIPRMGVYTASGSNMENEGVAPDVLVEQQPEELAKGIDPQLDKAVEVLQQEVVAWKKAHPTVVFKGEEGKPAAKVPNSSENK
jgi:tricorn protease